MTPKEYLIALEELELAPASKRAALAIGHPVRTLQRYAAGEALIPGSVERLLAMYQQYGLPKKYRLRNLPEGEYLV